MKRRIKIGEICCVLIIIIAIAFAPAETMATSKQATACKAYKKFLKKNVSHFVVEEGEWDTWNEEARDKCSYFLLADLNRDGIPELITEHEMGYKRGYLNLYTYKNGKVQSVKTKKGKKAKVDITCSAAGWYTVYSCKKGHLHADWDGSWQCDAKTKAAYNTKNGKKNRYLYGSWDNMEHKYQFYKNGKRITEKAFNAKYDKCKVKSYLHKNTAKNRRKYLK